MDKQNIEIINGIPVDWSKFKSKAKGSNLSSSRRSYVSFCELLHNKNHKLLSEYIDTNTKVLIDFNCGHEAHWIIPSAYKRGIGCPKCSGNCSEQAREDLIDLIRINNHKLLSEYVNTHTKVLIDFNCGHEPHWITPDCYKKGQGCPRCTGLHLEQAKKDLIKMINNNGHKLLSEYINTRTKVLIDFNCGHEPHWVTPHHYKQGSRCPKCSGHCSEYAKEVFIDLISKNGHKIISEYVDGKTKVLIDFNCGHDAHWITPSMYKSEHGCPRCVGCCPEQAREDFFNMLEENGHMILSEYINNSTKVLVDYNCGHEPHWILPSVYKSGIGCPKCSGHCSEQAKREFLNMLESNNHKLLSEYIDTKTKVLIDFNCGHEPHWMQPNSYKSGQGCPLCKNKGESTLYELLLGMGYEVEIQKKYEDLQDKGLLAYDFYIPKYNLLIELDGDHHRMPVPYYSKDMTQQEKDMAKLDAEKRFQDRKRKDRLKDEYAEKNNIPLLRIDYSKGRVELDRWKELILNKIKEIETKRELIAL